MAFEADWLVDRRRLKRRIVFWRTLAVVVAVGLVAAAAGRFSDLGGLAQSSYISRLQVSDIIVDDVKRRRALDEIADDSRARALILRIDSPGGTVVGGEALYKALLNVARKKPVVVVMGELATSAGYMIALAGDHIIAHEGTITGSIGVLFQTAEVTELLAKIGVSMDTIKSGPLKAAPSPFEKLTPEVRRVTQALVDDMYDMFVAMVAERRRMDRAEAKALADGRVYTGRQALRARLVDELGGEAEALAWLKRERGIDPSLPVRDLKPRREVEEILDYVGSLARKTTLAERLTLDGLVSVWHPRLQ
jgi:protease-4